MVLKEPEPGFYLKNLDFWDGSNFELDWFDYRTKKTPKSQYLRRESNPPVRTGGTTNTNPNLLIFNKLGFFFSSICMWWDKWWVKFDGFNYIFTGKG